VSTALLIHRLVAERFGGALRIGIGINTGVVIAGTIGGGGKLAFTLSATPSTWPPASSSSPKPPATRSFSLNSPLTPWLSRPLGLTDRGSHTLKGKSAPVQIVGLDAGAPSSP
jgi:class 3 adenylate cyclase